MKGKARTVLLAALAIGAGTSQSCATVKRADPVAAAAVVEPGRRGQWLFRGEATSDGESATLRITLRRLGTDTFEIVAADTLGQTRWRLLARGDDAIWLDPAARSFCRLSSRAALPQALLPVPIAPSEVPLLLLRELPPAPAAGDGPDGDGAAELVDAASRRWTGVRASGAWKSWTLWRGADPIVWFRSDGAEALLSGRRPAFQLRWRETASGPLPAGATVELEPPEDYTEGRCLDAPAA